MDKKINLYAHRGYVINESRENSIEALDFAYENNFDGVEYDIWYYNNELLIHHDPIEDIKGLSHFIDYFKYKNKLKYWIDFKNLDKISDSDLLKAIKMVKSDIEKSEIDLKNIYFAPFITYYDKAFEVFDQFNNIFDFNSQNVIVIDDIDKNDLIDFRNRLDQNNIKFISVNHKNIDQDFIDIFRGIEIFAWTVNDIKIYQTLIDLGIRNITSDDITVSVPTI